MNEETVSFLVKAANTPKDASSDRNYVLKLAVFSSISYREILRTG
jgi:hypothetical protein